MTAAVGESLRPNGPAVASSMAAYDHLLWGIAVLDASRRLLYYNQAFAEFLGEQTGLQFTTDDLLGQELPLEPLWEREPDIQAGRWQVELAGREGALVAEKHDGGSLADLHEAAVYLLQLSPRVDKEAEAAPSGLAEAITHGQSGDQEKIELLTSFSHEFRTPLNAVLGFGNLLLSEVSEPAQREYAEGVIGAGSHLLKLVNEILTLSKAEYDCSEIELRTKNTDVAAVVAECVALMQPMAREAGIELVRKGGACHLICDHTRLRQIILNLLSNAIKYNSAPGQVVINCLAIGTRCAGIEVQDDGLGVPPELSETIFNPFKRLLVGNAKTEGSGLGLMLTRRLVNMMGGRIRVRSRVGRGSIFAVDFNLDEDMSGTAGNQSQTIVCLGQDSAQQQFARELLAVRPGLEVCCYQSMPLSESVIAERQPALILVSDELLANPELQATEALDRLLLRVPAIGLVTAGRQQASPQLAASAVSAQLDEAFTPVDFYTLLDGLLPR